LCECGSSFDIDRIEIVSRNKNSILAKYFCHTCGREQMFAATTDQNPEFFELPVIEVPTNPITSDDVLDIKEEASGINVGQIRALAKRKVTAKVPIPK